MRFPYESSVTLQLYRRGAITRQRFPPGSDDLWRGTMATFTPGVQPVEQSRDKGLKTGALGLASSVVIGVASTAPAYSLAATLFFVVAAVGLKAPLVAVLAFVPMLLCSIGLSELNKADPDCGTTFIWGTRAFGPSAGWAGGWATVAADLLGMASLAPGAGACSALTCPPGAWSWPVLPR